MDAFPLGSESFPLSFTKLCLPCHILLSIYFAGGQRWTKAIYLVTENSFNSLHAEIVCTLAIINAEINVISLRVKVSSVA